MTTFATRWLLGLCVGLLGFITPDQTLAHTQSVSYSVWHLGPQTTASFRISELELNRFGLHPAQPNYASLVADLINQWIVLPSTCQSQPPQKQIAEPGWVRVQLQFTCTSQTPPTIGIQSLFDQVPYHTHLAAIYLANGEVVQTRFNADYPSWQAQTNSASHHFAAMFEFGLSHILTGWDHLLFLLVLLLGTPRLKQIITLVTGFTLGHSVTLAAQVLGFATPEAIAVEWVIAFSILFVAIQNTWASSNFQGLWPYALSSVALLIGWLGGALALALTASLMLFVFCQLRLQQQLLGQQPLMVLWFITLGFGLFHGFGFAGLLNELALPPGQQALPLLAFNLGVEVGQLLIIALALPALKNLPRLITQSHSWLNAGSAAAATFWLITRTF